MNVPTEELLGLANVLGVAGDTKTSAVVRLATERLAGEKEYHLEFFHPVLGVWHLVVGGRMPLAEAQQHRAMLLEHYPTNRYRVVEVLRRVLP